MSKIYLTGYYDLDEFKASKKSSNSNIILIVSSQSPSLDEHGHCSI